MKTKTQLLVTIVLFASMLVSFSYGERTENFIPIEASNTSFSCSSVAKIYLDEDNDADTLPDVYYYLNSNFTLNGSTNSYSAGQILRETNGTTYSKVQYYTPLANMIYKMTDTNQISPLDNYTFWRASRVFPYNTPLRGIATTTNKVVFERPSDNDPAKNIIGFLYNYKYKYAIGWDGSSVSSYRYNQVPSMSYLWNTYVTYHSTLPGSDGNRKRSWSSVQSYNTCRDYQLHRCGDGVIDTGDSSYVATFTWELCDDGPLNGTAGHCALSCGIAAATERCGDNVIQPAGSFYNGDTNNMSFEDCDDGDLTGDNGDGLVNGNDPQLNFCTDICLTPFVEAFTEEFVNQ